MFGTLARPLDGLKPGRVDNPPRPTAAPDQPSAGLRAKTSNMLCEPTAEAILPASSACGGIGRRARLRALWTIWSVEVRVLSGALEKPRTAGLFCVSGRLFHTPSAMWTYCCHVATNNSRTHRPATACGYAATNRGVRVSVRQHRGGWEVRWRDGSGRRRARRFASEEAARAFDEALAEVSPAARRAETARHGRSGGVYSYRTADGVRWRFVFRRSDGTQTSKRGFTSERAARDARRRLIEQVERGEVRHIKETFGALLGAVAGASPSVPRGWARGRVRDRRP